MSAPLARDQQGGSRVSCAHFDSSGRRVWPFRLAVSVLALVGGIVAAEVAVRVLGFEVAPRPSAPGGPLQYRVGPNGERCNRPGVYHQSYQLRRSDPPRVTTITVDERGYRSGVAAVDPRSGARIIACLGDSCTFGFGVDDDETWPYLLREALNVGLEVPEFDTLNAGLNAANTEEEGALFRGIVRACTPRLILLEFYLNDAAIGSDAIVGEDVSRTDPPALFRFVTQSGFARGVRERSRFVDLLADRWVKGEYLRFLSASRSALYTDEAPGWLRCQAELRKLRDQCGRRGIAFAVVLYPLLFRDGDVLTTHGAYKTVAAYLESIGVPCFDLEPAFLEHDVERLRVHPQDSHPNGEAHGIAARAIAAWLRDSDREDLIGAR